MPKEAWVNHFNITTGWVQTLISQLDSSEDGSSGEGGSGDGDSALISWTKQVCTHHHHRAVQGC